MLVILDCPECLDEFMVRRDEREGADLDPLPTNLKREPGRAENGRAVCHCGATLRVSTKGN